MNLGSEGLMISPSPVMDLSKLSTARKLELMKSFIRERPKTGMKLKVGMHQYHPSEKRKQAFQLMNPNFNTSSKSKLSNSNSRTTL